MRLLFISLSVFVVLYPSSLALTALSEFIGWPIHKAVLLWIAAGGLAFIFRGFMAFPLPRGDRLDPIGAARLLWWLAWWPRCLRQGK